MTTEELYKKYGDVKVFVLPSLRLFRYIESYQYIYAFGNIEECTPIKNFDITWIEHVGEFKPRYLMEMDTNYRQIIPYVIVKCVDKYLCARRKQGDTRLIGKMSAGWGGHVDKCKTTCTTQSIIKDSLIRELEEELNIDCNTQISNIKLIGMIQCNETDVDKVHFGLVYLATVIDESITVKETEILEGEWFSADTLTRMNDLPWETWSRLCIDKLIGGGHCDKEK